MWFFAYIFVIGGDRDGAAKTLIGIAVLRETNEVQFLIAVSIEANWEYRGMLLNCFILHLKDPHYDGREDAELMLDGGHVKWHDKDLFDPSSFYNLCLPQS